MLQLLHLDIIVDHLFEFRVLLLQNEKLLVQIVCSTSSFEIEYFLKMLDFFLEFCNQSIVSSADLVCTDFSHDLLGSICKLQS